MVENGYELPSMVVKGIQLPKLEDEWDEMDMKHDMS